MYSREEKERARVLRQSRNAAERRAWYAIRAHAKGKISVRRQHPVGGFYLDFFCPLAKLALELDGSSHDDNQDYDHWRTVELEKLGIEVVRAHNCMTDAFNLDRLAEWYVELCLARLVSHEQKGPRLT